jgi:hypothetical protein
MPTRQSNEPNADQVKAKEHADLAEEELEAGDSTKAAAHSSLAVYYQVRSFTSAPDQSQAMRILAQALMTYSSTIEERGHR